jgi:hypothetical protein
MFILVYSEYSCTMPIAAAARSKASAVFARSNTGIVGLNPNPDMDVCAYLFRNYVVSCVGSFHAKEDSPYKVFYRMCIGLRN